MENWIDFYQILGVDPDCDQEKIKQTYRDKVQILHPDRLMKDYPERIQRQAEEDLKKLNQAYSVLGDPQKRAQYHAEWMQRNADVKTTYLPKPKPAVNPTSILVKNLEPGEFKVVSFTVQNLGGPYKKIWISNPDNWAKLVGWSSVGNDELPLKVEFEIGGKEWGKTYSERIIVKLDEEEIVFTIKLQTKPKPVERTSFTYSQQPSYVPPSPPPPPPPPPPRPTPQPPLVKPDVPMPAILKWLIGIGSIVIVVIGINLIDDYNQSKSRQTQDQIMPQPQTTIQSIQPVKPVTLVPMYTLVKYRHYLDQKTDIDSRIETNLGKWITERFNLKMRWISFREWEGVLSTGYLDIQDYAINGENVWAVGNESSKGYIFHSSDNGTSWEFQFRETRSYPSRSIGDYPFVVYFLNETEGWVGSKDGLFYTQDGGRNWRFSVDPREEIMYGLGDYKSTYWFYNNYRIVAKIAWGDKHESLDGGKSWRIISGDQNP